MTTPGLFVGLGLSALLATLATGLWCAGLILLSAFVDALLHPWGLGAAAGSLFVILIKPSVRTAGEIAKGRAGGLGWWAAIQAALRKGASTREAGQPPDED